MRLPSFRFSMRSMMIAVAIVGVITSLEVTRRRTNVLRQKAAFHLTEQKSALQHIDFLAEQDQQLRDRFAFMIRTVDETTKPMELAEEIKQDRNRADREESRQSAEWHGQLAEKYSYAAAHPWFTVAIDNPAPPMPRYYQKNINLKKFLDDLVKDLQKSSPPRSEAPRPNTY